MSKKKKVKKTVGFIALGCPKNVVDSEKMLSELVQDGFLLSNEAEDSDVIVVNTCGFIEPAKQEALEAIRGAVELKETGKVQRVIVVGCLAERLGEGLFDEVAGIDIVAGLGYRGKIAEIVRESLKHAGQRAYTSKGKFTEVTDDRARLLIGPEHSAYLRISEGCDWKCSFCTIPSIRGPFRSKGVDAIVEEAAELGACGVKELNVIGQDTASWGRDLKIVDGLGVLLGELSKVEGLEWIRLMYLYPAYLSDKVIDSIAGNEKVLKYFDLPLQHINNEILRDMRRPETSEKIYRLIEKLREAMPDVRLRTTFIVGFPGETDEQFAELVKFVRWARFDAMGCFPYYAEKGTDAAEMDGQVSEEVKERRVDELMVLQQGIAFEKNEEMVGSEIDCIIDEAGGGQGCGRYYGQAMEIDSVCYVEQCRAEVGGIVRCKVVGTKDYDLIVEQI